MLDRALEGQQLETVTEPDAVRLGEADVRGLAPRLRETAQRLGADAVARRQVDDRLEDDQGPPAATSGGEPRLDLLALPLPR